MSEKKTINFKQSFSNRRFKMGAYHTLITAIVLIVIVVLNLLVTKMNITVDLSSDQKYTLTEDTKNMVKNLNNKITLYYIVQDGQEVDVIRKVVDQYAKAGGNVKVETKDPVVYPTFTKQYTEDEVQNNDIIVVNETNNKSKLVASADMIPVSMNYETYSQEYNTLDAEGQITSAIQAVSSTETKKAYVTKGHEEKALSNSFSDLFKKSNIEVEETRTDSMQKMPDDCDYLIINGPAYDFSSVECTVIKNYLENGGKALFTLNGEASNESLKNFYGLLKEYGIEVQNGFVIEDEKHAIQYATVVNATKETHDITDQISETKPAIVPVTKGMSILSDVRSTLTVEPLLTSSEESFARVNSSSNATKKEDGDIAGPFSLGVAVTDTYRDESAKLVVFGSYEFGNENFISSDQYGNRSTLLNTINWMSDTETSTLAIPTRSLSETTVEVASGERTFWSVLLVGVLPIGVLSLGFVIWYRRRKS